MTGPLTVVYGAAMRRQIGVLASHGARPGALVPPWVYRAVAYDPEDPFRQPVWMCTHDHKSAHDAQRCGTEWELQGGQAAASS